MNVVVLVGRLSSPPRRAELPSGDERWSFELSCVSDPQSPIPSTSAAGESVTLSVPVSVVAPCPGVERFDTGTQLAVIGVVRRRFYRAGGVTQSRTEVVAQSVVPITPRRSLDRALATSLRALGCEQARRLRSGLPEVGAA